MPRIFRRQVRILGAAVGLATLAACGETGVSAPLAPSTVVPVLGPAVSGVAGQTLPDPVEVLVRGPDNQPLAGVTVTFAATGAGAAVNPATTTTDANGIARTRWTLGTAAAPSSLTVTAGGATTTINATAVAAAPGSVALNAGGNQTAVAGAAVPIAPSVRVVDAFGNPVSGAPVTFSVFSGGGTVTNFTQNTNAQGIATVGSWVLGPTAGEQRLIGRVEASGVANNPIVFTATASAGGASRVTAVSATSQTGAAGAAVAARPSVLVTDANGNPVSNATVTFAVTAGGGQLTGAVQTTNAQGLATVGSWILGSAVGANQVTATVAGAGSVAFTATSTPGAATQLIATAGNNQQAQINRPVLIAPTVVARDALGNPVAGVEVTFAATAGGGIVISNRQVTDATGSATVGAWFLGSTPGTNTLTATAPGLAAVAFTATATPGLATSMAPNSAIVQTGSAGQPVADPPSVVVRDVTGNPVPGIIVTFAVTAGGGSIVGSPATTDINGIASLTSWTLGPAIVPNTVVASSPGLPSISFTASPGAGAAANVVVAAGNNGQAVQGTALLPRPAVKVTDANGNNVVGAIVTFAVTGGGGTITGATQATDAAGVATVGSWVLGPAAPNTLTATVTGNNITGNPVTFTAAAATAIAVTSAPAVPINIGANFSIAVQLNDAAGDPVLLGGIPLTIAIASGGGTLNGTTTVSTNASGQATFTVNVAGAPGARTFSISGTGLTAATTAAITFN